MLYVLILFSLYYIYFFLLFKLLKKERKYNFVSLNIKSDNTIRIISLSNEHCMIWKTVNWFYFNKIYSLYLFFMFKIDRVLKCYWKDNSFIFYLYACVCMRERLCVAI